MRSVVAVSIVGPILVCCIILAFIVFASAAIIDYIDQSKNVGGCVPPPAGFSEKDLVGTWRAGTLDQSDTLVIREDGTYKQIIHIEFAEAPTVDFESEWRSWWIEYADNGIPYLHLKGMHLCGSNPDIDCEQEGGGERDWNAYNENFYWDMCRNTSVIMSDEGILAIHGYPANFVQPPRGFILHLFFNCTDCGGWAYEFKEP